MDISYISKAQTNFTIYLSAMSCFSGCKSWVFLCFICLCLRLKPDVWVRLWIGCELHATGLLLQTVSITTNGEMCVMPDVNFLSFSYLFCMLQLYSTLLQMTTCFKTWIFLNIFIYLCKQNCFAALFPRHADVSSLATCILTSMRDLYSVTLRSPFSPASLQIQSLKLTD